MQTTEFGMMFTTRWKGRREDVWKKHGVTFPGVSRVLLPVMGRYRDVGFVFHFALASYMLCCVQFISQEF